MDKVTYRTVMRWTDEECRAYLEKMRWPNGVVCPKCGATEPYRITRKTQTKNVCKACSNAESAESSLRQQ